MKTKNILTFVSVIVGIVSIAACVAVIVDRILKKKECYEGYIECECNEDEISE